MVNKADYRILCLRNETSLFLDDLVALVINSTVAFDLRLFSNEVMQLTPGFTFNLNQAKALKKLTENTLKQYEAKAIGDVDLMNYCSKANAIVKGESITNGRKGSMFKNLFHRKDEKWQADLDEAERNYRETCDKIIACQQTMEHCVESSRGLPPDSQVYRDNERAFTETEQKIKTFKQMEQRYRKLLEAANRRKLIDQYTKELEHIEALTKKLMGDGKDFGKSVAKAEVLAGTTGETLNSYDNYGSTLLDGDDDIVVPTTNSNFGAQVAASERRHAVLEMSGASDSAPAESEVNDESASLAARDADRSKE